MNTFLSVDQHLFLFINHLPHNGLFNALALFLSGVGTAGIIWFVFGGLLFYFEEKKDHWFIVKLAGLGITTWIVVEKILKPMMARPRPSLDIGSIIVGNSSTDFSFPSGHAAIAWAMAYLLAKKEPRFRWVFYMLAGAISFSRIYLGKHYPMDVVAGGLLGWGIGFIVLRMKGGGKKPAV